MIVLIQSLNYPEIYIPSIIGILLFLLSTFFHITKKNEVEKSKGLFRRPTIIGLFIIALFVLLQVLSVISSINDIEDVEQEKRNLQFQKTRDSLNFERLLSSQEQLLKGQDVLIDNNNRLADQNSELSYQNKRLQESLLDTKEDVLNSRHLMPDELLLDGSIELVEESVSIPDWIREGPINAQDSLYQDRIEWLNKLFRNVTLNMVFHTSRKADEYPDNKLTYGSLRSQLKININNNDYFNILNDPSILIYREENSIYLIFSKIRIPINKNKGFSISDVCDTYTSFTIIGEENSPYSKKRIIRNCNFNISTMDGYRANTIKDTTMIHAVPNKHYSCVLKHKKRNCWY